jgi:cysteine desulfurase
MEGVRRLRDEFEAALQAAVPVSIHSASAPRLPNTSCFSVLGDDGERLADALALEGIIVGTGAACSAGSVSPPKTVLALGAPYAHAVGTLRVSLSPLSAALEVRSLVTALQRHHHQANATATSQEAAKPLR